VRGLLRNTSAARRSLRRPTHAAGTRRRPRASPRKGEPSSAYSAAATEITLPRQLGLQLARLVAQAPAGPEWLHEVKYDGYRVLIWREGAAVRVSSRGDQDWSERLPDLLTAAARLRCRSCVLDGELVALDAQGRSDFGELQREFGDAQRATPLRAMVFDLLYLDGEDLRALPQLARKKRLALLLRGCTLPLTLTKYELGNGPAAARAACAAGLEGIVCKAVTAPYEEGRSGAWLKVKCVESDEFAVVGYTSGQGARARLGALLLATPSGDSHWRYCGRVGTGLDERTIATLLRRLKKTSAAPDFENPPTRAQLRGATPVWTRPELVVEVELRGRTEDGLLRQASLKGIRADRSIGSLRVRQRDVAAVESPLRAPKGR
jgi:bifunctional non-homologous end joining protein LigD